MIKSRTRTSHKTSSVATETTLPTFMDHVRELQGRLFAVVIAFVIFSAATYPFFDKIVNFLVAPLGKEYELVYLTPGGAFSFIIQACMYVGLILTLPVIIYNIYRFIIPAVKQQTLQKALGFTVASLVLALGGMAFAYFVSLPAALYFLTNFNLYHINPMLTIDSYFSFVMTYMLAGALLFQIPLIMAMINGATPLQPKKLMRLQDKVILGSFIMAAIISPTPDAMNQILLASPMVVMYQAGIILVWARNRRKFRQVDTVLVRREAVAKTPLRSRQLPVSTAPIKSTAERPSVSAIKQLPVHHRSYGIEGFAVNRAVTPRRRPAIQLNRPLPPIRTQLQRSTPRIVSPVRRSIDGFVISA